MANFFRVLEEFARVDDRQSRIDMFEKFSWKIENFSRLTDSDQYYSEPFVLCGHPWRILVYPYGNDTDCVSIYLDYMQSPNSHQREIRDVTFSLFVFNQFDSCMTITKETDHVFSEREKSWGFTHFIPLAEIHNPGLGFLVNDVIIIGTEVYVHNSWRENHVNPTANFTSGSHSSSGHMEVPRPMPLPMPQAHVPNLESLSEFPTLVHTEPTRDTTDVELFSDSVGELMDFAGLGKVEKSFVPLLNEVCSHHPSLIECQQRRSRKFTEWAFTALGRVLYFLKTRKVKDMNEQACKDLQMLWEELETFKFDLTWLEPHVQSALGMKNYVEKAVQMEELKKYVESLTLEMESFKTKLATVEVHLDIAKDLLKEESLNERHLNAELGYGMP
ncbi:MATH domain and coiled-coil domain-containing protein At3g58370-like [Trifolium pratense]|uniref:MATH domain and coiled-coil domain-containing protein At3g58370-like n=1 Tax=Trifolium pratense TaxID=57577 RepID=UPI001E690624|nr:MATH domain and coiled-coil domain-containing protein At3g58370-like [Trifolium pratense]